MSTRLHFGSWNKTIFGPLLKKNNEEFNQPGQFSFIQFISSTAQKSFRLLPRKTFH